MSKSAQGWGLWARGKSKAGNLLEVRGEIGKERGNRGISGNDWEGKEVPVL